MTTAVASRIEGIFQVRRTAENWIIIPIVYGSGVSFQPLEMTSKQAVELFGACQLPKASLAQESFIIELTSPVTIDLLAHFGFKALARV
ncbi:MAG TPA: hypothetical protein V6C81_24355 [Planktothrix sp.]|jgi:hypothetical protein